ncbi:MAG: hypothetical protein V4574_08390 [Pseudomonadota bacterium]
MNDFPKTDPEIVHARQRARATVMAWILGGFVLLVFAISIVKIKLGMPG